MLKPRTIFTFMIYATVCYLVIVGKAIPDLIADAFFVMLGFWFGEKIGRKNGHS